MAQASAWTPVAESNLWKPVEEGPKPVLAKPPIPSALQNDPSVHDMTRDHVPLAPTVNPGYTAGIEQMSEPGIDAKAGGLSKILRTAGEGIAPIAAPMALMAGPVTAGIGAVAGGAGAYGAEHALPMMGVGPGMTSLVSDAAGMIGAHLGSKLPGAFPGIRANPAEAARRAILAIPKGKDALAAWDFARQEPAPPAAPERWSVPLPARPAPPAAPERWSVPLPARPAPPAAPVTTVESAPKIPLMQPPSEIPTITGKEIPTPYRESFEGDKGGTLSEQESQARTSIVNRAAPPFLKSGLKSADLSTPEGQAKAIQIGRSSLGWKPKYMPSPQTWEALRTVMEQHENFKRISGER